MQRYLNWFTTLYPVWLVGLSIIAFFNPESMLWFDKNWIFWSLAASMLAMGLTIDLADFKRIGKMPGSVALGFICQVYGHASRGLADFHRAAARSRADS